MPGTALFEKPRWLRDLLRFLPLKSQFVLSGNIRDLQACEVVPGTVTAQSFNQTLCDALLDAGYAQVLAWDPLAGFRVLGRPGSEAGATPQVLLDLGLTPVDGAAPAGTDLLGATLQRLVNRNGEPIALIIDFASRLAVRNDALSAAEHQLFTQALVLSHQARSRPAGEQRKPFFNSVLWVVEKEGDLPDWLLVDNPRLRHIPVSKPDQAARRALARRCSAGSAARASPRRPCNRPPRPSSRTPKACCSSISTPSSSWRAWKAWPWNASPTPCAATRSASPKTPG
ncbi:putative chaperone [Pseudomonas aeruginosa]|nr:putative chaperone [Pseudomonas aeruginosa]